jgi:hypothetical protein
VSLIDLLPGKALLAFCARARVGSRIIKQARRVLVMVVKIGRMPYNFTDEIILLTYAKAGPPDSIKLKCRDNP